MNFEQPPLQPPSLEAAREHQEIANVDFSVCDSVYDVFSMIDELEQNNQVLQGSQKAYTGAELRDLLITVLDSFEQQAADNQANNAGLRSASSVYGINPYDVPDFGYITNAGGLRAKVLQLARCKAGGHSYRVVPKDAAMQYGSVPNPGMFRKMYGK